MKKLTIGFLSALALPLVAFAQTLEPLKQFVNSVKGLVDTLIPLLIGIAIVVFFWGLVRYLWGGGGKADTEGAKTLMIWGLVTLFIMVSVWGIIRIAGNALGIGQGGNAIAPGSPVPNTTPGSTPYNYDL